MHFLKRRGLCGEIFLFAEAGLGEAEVLLGRGGGKADKAASYSSFHETDSDFSTTSSTRGESGPMEAALESSNMLWVRGADTGLPPRENLRGVPEHELVVSVPSQ